MTESLQTRVLVTAEAELRDALRLGNLQSGDVVAAARIGALAAMQAVLLDVVGHCSRALRGDTP